MRHVVRSHPRGKPRGFPAHLSNGHVASLKRDKKIPPSMLNALMRGEATLVEPTPFIVKISGEAACRWLTTFGRAQAERLKISDEALRKEIEPLCGEELNKGGLTHGYMRARARRRRAKAGSARYQLALGLELMCRHLLEPHLGIGLGSALLRFQGLDPSATAFAFDMLFQAIIQSIQAPGS